MNLSESTITRPSALLEISGVPDFWERVHNAPHRLLAIDYDGTLAPFRVARERAVPLAGVREALHAIRDHEGTSLAILSGRPAAQVAELLGREMKIPIYGDHGWELIRPDGQEESFTITADQEDALAEALVMAVDAGFEEKLERKVASVALHTRGMTNAHDIETRFRALWQPLADEHALTLMTFNRGVELRARERHKGMALKELFEAMPRDTLPIYIGDDATDEDAFRFIKPFGIGIKVGARHTAAVGHLSDPRAVLQLLHDWPEAVSARRIPSSM